MYETNKTSEQRSGAVFAFTSCLLNLLILFIFCVSVWMLLTQPDSMEAISRQIIWR